MPTIRLTPADAAALERLARERGGSAGGRSQIAQEASEPSKVVEERSKRHRTRQTTAPTQETALDVPTAVLYVPGWTPSSLNDQIGVHWAVKARIKKEVRQIVAAMAMVQEVTKATCRRRVDMHIILGPGRKRIDKDNTWKASLDALKHAGLIVDDSDQWLEEGRVVFSRGCGAVLTSGTYFHFTDR